MVVTFRFQAFVGEYLTLHTALNETTAGAVAFCLIFIVVLGLLKVVMILLLRMLKVGDGGLLNKIVGMVLGSCRWLLILSLAFVAIGQSPLNTLKTDIEEDSVVGPQLVQVAPTLFGFLSSIAPELAASKDKE